MAEFGAAATLQISVPDRELRGARQTIQDELGDVQVQVDAQQGGAAQSLRTRTDGGGNMLAAGGGAALAGKELEDQTELLAEIRDLLDAGGGAGGGGGGSGLASTVAAGAAGAGAGAAGSWLLSMLAGGATTAASATAAAASTPAAALMLTMVSGTVTPRPQRNVPVQRQPPTPQQRMEEQRRSVPQPGDRPSQVYPDSPAVSRRVARRIMQGSGRPRPGRGPEMSPGVGDQTTSGDQEAPNVRNTFKIDPSIEFDGVSERKLRRALNNLQDKVVNEVRQQLTGTGTGQANQDPLSQR